MIKFGPAGFCNMFLENHSHSEQIPSFLKENGLDAYEYAFNRGVNISDEKDSFSVYTKGLYEFEVADREDRAISVTLFRAFPKETFFLESNLAQLQGNLSFELSLDFEKGAKSELIKRSASFRTGLISDIKKGENGEIEVGNVITVSGNAVLSSFRMRDLITGEPTVRIYDVDGGSEGEIVFPKALQTAYRVKQNGKVCCDVKFTSNKLKYKLKAKEIATFKVTFSENWYVYY